MSARNDDDRGREHAAVVAAVRAAANQDLAARHVIGALAGTGARSYVVGGAVRDFARGVTPKDIDLLVAGLDADRLQGIVEGLPGRADITGKHFGVLRYRHRGGSEVEIALPRRERSTGDGHRDFEVDYDPQIPIETDLARRDFTANAMAVELDSGELIDPFGGWSDVRAGRLRLVSDSAFAEDPLRILRAIGSRSRHGLIPDVQTMSAMRSEAGRLHHLPADRLQAEWGRIIAGFDPAAGIELARSSGVLSHLIPELDALDPERFEFSRLALARCAHESGDPDVRAAALFGWIAPDELAPRLESLRFPVRSNARITHLARCAEIERQVDPAGVRRMLAVAGRKDAIEVARLRRIRAVVNGDDAGVADEQEMIAVVLNREDPLSVADLAIRGNEVAAAGVPAGPAIGRALSGLLDWVLEDPSRNHPELLLGRITSHHVP